MGSAQNLTSADLEAAIAALWKEVLPVARTLEKHDNFLALGGDSIAMVTVLYRIEEEFAVQLPPESLLTHPSLGGLSSLVDAAIRSSHGE